MEIRTIAVIGAGVTGRGIAFAAVLAGYTTVLEDVSDTILADAMCWIHETLDDDVRRGKLDAASRDAALAGIVASQEVVEAIRNAELIVEAVADELETKLELFTIFDKFAKPNAIFATTATALSIDDFSDIVVFRERCIGMHFFAGENKDQVEIIRAPETSEETIATCVAVVRRMNKTAVIKND
jgi:3-hydroxybutyryl-CoA dehydrogenase